LREELLLFRDVWMPVRGKAVLDLNSSVKKQDIREWKLPASALLLAL